MDDLRRHADAWSGFVLANLLWVVFSLPLVTMPAATAGLMAVMSERVRGVDGSVFDTFFGAMRTRWRAARVVGLIDLIVGGLIALNLTVFGMMTPDDPIMIVSGAMTLFVAILLLSANVYALGLLGLDELRARRVLDMSVRLALAYPLRTFATVAAALGPVVVSLLLPRAVLVLVTGSCVASVVAWGSWRVIRRHLTDDELKEYTGRSYGTD